MHPSWSERNLSFRRTISEARKDVKSAFKTLARSSSRSPSSTAFPEILSCPDEAPHPFGGVTPRIPTGGPSSLRPPIQRDPTSMPEPTTQLSHTIPLQEVAGASRGPPHESSCVTFPIPQPIELPPSHQTLATIMQNPLHHLSFAGMPQPDLRALHSAYLLPLSSVPHPLRPSNPESAGQYPGAGSAPPTVQVSSEQPSWYTGVKSTLVLIERAPDVFPPLKRVIAAANSILGVYDGVTFGDRRKDFERLSERAKLVYDVMRSAPTDPPQEFKDRRDGLGRALTQLAIALEKKSNLSLASKGVSPNSEDRADIVRLVREVSFAIEIAILDVSVKNGSLVYKLVAAIDWMKDGRGGQLLL
ncbi:hypothetical protein FA13DRAFT_1813808 [Coprinellus micaceus]|uniref:Uncharacterized protein n=1 Tax=Coprinellus micaceus TaxID=71717 RepID=A0A4Y7TBM6_COPMI|nr:hypothetical protein FA13DRAFT_1818194 [Coprinellus micaceus]TEB31577.1 hypothetical protein FA13DRAFT_1813808 [Coprinellus micaceus]